jgi:hypothetical protein
MCYCIIALSVCEYKTHSKNKKKELYADAGARTNVVYKSKTMIRTCITSTVLDKTKS